MYFSKFTISLNNFLFFNICSYFAIQFIISSVILLGLFQPFCLSTLSHSTGSFSTFLSFWVKSFRIRIKIERSTLTSKYIGIRIRYYFRIRIRWRSTALQPITPPSIKHPPVFVRSFLHPTTCNLLHIVSKLGTILYASIHRPLSLVDFLPIS